MANTLLTLSVITREAVRLWQNSNAFLMNISRQYDDQYAKTGAKAGTQLRIRLPNDYTVGTGATIVPQDTTEQSVTMTLATQKNVAVAFTAAEKTLALDDFSERVMAPAVNNLAGAVAADIMLGVEGGVSNFVANQANDLTTLAPNATTVLNGGAALDINAAGNGQRWLVADPFTMARSVGTLAGLFNPAPEISRQYRNADIKDALGFTWAKDQTVIKHQTGTLSAATVNGAGQTGQNIVTNATTGTLTKGDIITIAGVYAVNPITKQSTGSLRQFVVTAAAPSGSTSINVFPAIIGAVGGVAGGASQPYMTTDSSPANGAAIALVNKAGEVYRKNIAFAPDAIQFAMADLYMPTKGVSDSARVTYDQTSMRMITQYSATTDIETTRLDVLYGYLFVRPSWAVAIGDAV